MLVRAYEDPADRRANEHVRACFPGGSQEGVQIADRLLDGLVGRSRVAPRQPGPIVGADPSGVSDLGLHESPVDGERTPARHQDDDRTTLADAVEVQLAAPNVDQPARGRVTFGRLWLGEQRCGGEKPDEYDEETTLDSHSPSPSRVGIFHRVSIKTWTRDRRLGSNALGASTLAWPLADDGGT